MWDRVQLYRVCTRSASPLCNLSGFSCQLWCTLHIFSFSLLHGQKYAVLDPQQFRLEHQGSASFSSFEKSHRKVAWQVQAWSPAMVSYVVLHDECWTGRRHCRRTNWTKTRKYICTTFVIASLYNKMSEADLRDQLLPWKRCKHQQLEAFEFQYFIYLFIYYNFWHTTYG